MPFIGKDWRSPGEAWVKTETLGWQRMKIIESQLWPTCHFNAACSWPPRSEFGQHMVTSLNCNQESSSVTGSDTVPPSPTPASSASSPSGSPERHLIQPITISSPYGQFTYCSRHFEPLTPPTSPTSVPKAKDNSSRKTHLVVSQLSRGLSHEQLVTITAPSDGPRLRYNTSVSDFRRDSLDRQSQKVDNSNSNFYRHDRRIANNECDQQQHQLPPSPPTASCCCAGASCNSSSRQRDPHVRAAPHCRVSVRTREVAMYNTISEAFYRLDFCNAIHDIRRFNYICKLLHLLITQNLTSLSGCATKVLFNMLEQVAWEVSINKRNIHVLKNLLNELKQMIQKYYCWGRPIGSSLLWQQHFDTIERISQMVDAIELSQPNVDQSQITFNHLPVEMIREILLRLVDYKDLLNSAQASPVMSSMIDGQYIWQSLCRYHFTENQLKLALDNRNSGLFTKRGNNLRGIKYARTTSADGKTSFRNPVTHKPTAVAAGQQAKQTGADATAFTTASCDQSSSFRSIQGENKEEEERGGGDARKLEGDGRASYVTRAIRIFDKAGPVAGSRSNRVKQLIKSDGDESEQSNKRNVIGGGDEVKVPETSKSHEDRLLNSNRSNHEIDWERIFHQLRKKFDLKEEYADCLLLCRHCRCLFWKSFGHPCIINDDINSAKGSFKIIRRTDDDGVGQCNCDSATSSSQALGHRQQRDSNGYQNRVSVAMLSRNFDNGPRRGSSGRNRPTRNEENESLRVNGSNNGNRPFDGHEQQRQQRHLESDNSRPLRERYVRLANRRLGDEEGANGNNNNSTGAEAKRNDLVPKHVTISPQAFLKFFSL